MLNRLFAHSHRNWQGQVMVLWPANVGRHSLIVEEGPLASTLLPQFEELISLRCAACLPHVVIVAVELMGRAGLEVQAPAGDRMCCNAQYAYGLSCDVYQSTTAAPA